MLSEAFRNAKCDVIGCPTEFVFKSTDGQPFLFLMDFGWKVTTTEDGIFLTCPPCVQSNVQPSAANQKGEQN